MAVDRKVRCQITGKMYNFNPDYFTSKVEEYGDSDNIKKYFITKKAKTFLDRGYSIQEIRNILNVAGNDLYSPDSQEVAELIEFHKVKSNITAKKVASTLNFATHKSDPDVLEFINNIRNYE
jgi:RPA family protein